MGLTMPVQEKTLGDYEELVEALRNARPPVPIEEEQIEELASRAGIRRVLRGQIVMEQGAPSEELYFLISGQVRTIDISGSQPRLLNYHAARTFVGERGMLTGQPRSATVDAVSDAKLAYWDRADFNWLLGLNDQVRPYLERLSSERVRRAERDFPGKQWDEVIIEHRYKHPLMLINALVGPVLLLLFGLGLSILLLVLGGETLGPAGLGVLVTALIVALGWGVYNYIDWRDDEYIVTTKRVIHIERYVIYGEKRDEAPLIRIQDVTTQADNFWQRLLNYYDVTIQTAGAGKIVFRGIRDADQVMEAIFRERDRAQERREAADVASIRKALAQRMQRQIPDVDVPVDTLVPTTGLFRERRRRRLPRLLDYFWPRVTIVQGDTITWRKHWFVWLKKTLPAMLTSIVLLALTILLLLELPPFDALEGARWVLGLLLVFATFVAFIWYIYAYDDWHKDVYIVTRDRIIDVESSSFRLRGEQSRQSTFDVVQNITYSVPTFFNRLLNMGDVVIETAGTAETFTFRRVFDPSSIQQEIVNRMVAYQEDRRRQQRIQEDIRNAQWFGEYHQLLVGKDHLAS
jgi:uncharacterized membrane protein YdbT with pleckstrin-like domain